MAEAVFASEEVEEFAANAVFGRFYLLLAIVARFAEYFFVSNRPGNARYGDGEYEQPDNLENDRHEVVFDAAIEKKAGERAKTSAIHVEKKRGVESYTGRVRCGRLCESSIQSAEFIV